MAYGDKTAEAALLYGAIAGNLEKFSADKIFDLIDEGGVKIDLFEEDPIDQLKKMQEEIKPKY